MTLLPVRSIEVNKSLAQDLGILASLYRQLYCDGILHHTRISHCWKRCAVDGILQHSLHVGLFALITPTSAGN